MRLASLLLLALLLAACGGGSERADDPADPPDRAARPPQTIPAAPGEVRTRGVVTVLDDGRGAELCLGPVAESWPPQCGGPPVVGWDWRRQVRVPGGAGGPGGDAGTGFEQAAGVRWGQYALAGRWDGESFTVTAAVPGAQYQPPVDEPEPLPPPEDPADQATLERVVRELGALPGAQSSFVTDGRAHVDVVYDDGSLQEWADATYGAGVVVVTSLLVDV